MTDNEKAISSLTRDVAVVLEIQKNCQMSQVQTTKNVDKLVTAVDKVSHDTLLLGALDSRVGKLEDKDKWWNRTFITTVISVCLGIGWYLIKGE